MAANITTMVMNSTIASNATIDTLRQQCVKDFALRNLYDFLQMFYIIWPSEDTAADPTNVHNYELSLVPMASLFMVLEQVIRLYQRQKVSRIQDVVTNVGSSIIFLFARVLFLGMIIHLYIYLYDHYRILDMPVQSIWTWIVSLLLVEFVYYWTHRALHEFNILWAAHQFHHMAEDLNVTTAIRDSVVDLILYDIFPIPLAFVIPPQILVVHMQFSLIYQIWLHNSVVGNLGFLEYIINTPRQHLVHHGKNPYCIDKNYGALLMIWDRMFGTYQREREDDKLVFGVVSPTPKTFDPMILQFGYYRDVYKKFCQMETFGDKISALVKGPGWSPGKPRLGLISDVPEPDRSLPKYSYDPPSSPYTKLYVMSHLFIQLLILYYIGHHELIRLSYMKSFAVMIFIIISLTSFGFIFDHRKFAPHFEILRCLLYFAFDYYIAIQTPWPLGSGQRLVFDLTIGALRMLYVVSIIGWTVYMCVGGGPEENYPKTLYNDSSSSSSGSNRSSNGNISNSNGGDDEKGSFGDHSVDSGTALDEEKNIASNGMEKKLTEVPNLAENLKMAQKFIAKQESKQFNVHNIVATVLFLSVFTVITYILYFVQVDTCSELINELTPYYNGTGIGI